MNRLLLGGAMLVASGASAFAACSVNASDVSGLLFIASPANNGALSGVEPGNPACVLGGAFAFNLDFAATFEIQITDPTGGADIYSAFIDTTSNPVGQSTNEQLANGGGLDDFSVTLSAGLHKLGINNLTVASGNQPHDVAVTFGDETPVELPEPASMGLLAFALFGLAAIRRQARI